MFETLMDAPTELPNWALFNDRLQVALAHARHRHLPLAVMLLDLDRFKDVNDTLGHAVGDHLLQTVGRRLKSILRDSDTVCPIRGGEFLLLLPGIASVEDAGKVAERILQAIRKAFVVDSHELRITASLGIALYPDDGQDGDTLIRNADVAMYRAKEEGRDNYRWSTSPRADEAATLSGEAEDESREQNKRAADRPTGGDAPADQ